MTGISYDPACRDCRFWAGKDIAGTTWQCWAHIAHERDEARAEVEQLLRDLKHESDQRFEADRALATEREAHARTREHRDKLLEVVGADDKTIAKLTQQLAALRDQLRIATAEVLVIEKRCGTCADFAVADSVRYGHCVSKTSECAEYTTAYWSADHSCPSWLEKETP